MRHAYRRLRSAGVRRQIRSATDVRRRFSSASWIHHHRSQSRSRRMHPLLAEHVRPRPPRRAPPDARHRRLIRSTRRPLARPARRGGGATGRDRRRLARNVWTAARLAGDLDRRYSRPHARRSPRHQPGDDRADRGRSARLQGLVDGPAGTRDDDIPPSPSSPARPASARPACSRSSSAPSLPLRPCSSPTPSPARSAARSTSSGRCSATPRPTSSTLAPWRSTPSPHASARADRS